MARLRVLLLTLAVLPDATLAEEQQGVRRHRHMRRQGPFQEFKSVPPNRFGTPQEGQEHSETVNLTMGSSKDTEGKVVSQWACALMCASRATQGCCSYQGELGVCEFQPGTPGTNATVPGWTQARCTPGYATAKCAPWEQGKCMGQAQPAAEGLAIWELLWEDHFDTDTCVLDGSGVLRPSPEFWSSEIGYKRGKAHSRQLPPIYRPSRPGKIGGVWLPPRKKAFPRQDDSGSAPACDCSQSAEFTSASLMTKGKKEFSYGLFELRAKIDTRPGAWSSWWAIGDFDFVPWPKNGQIDILDAFQHMLKASVTHAGESGLPSSAIQHAGARMLDRDWEKYYHTWQLEWDSDFIQIRVDGETLLKVDLKVADAVRTSWPNPFTRAKKFFLILNLAIGGHAGGDATLTEFPMELRVDYIRVFQKRGYTS
ncbi:unnamed protein product [Cladocopium goreaui]|uniref:Beta-glucanase n=1 Tax=Cladocopium goreaui TaxID=2562237 RepID=A0A9P1CL14_9DINO|nr:unnamed protein product [Cladocopium goreaui]